MTRIPVSYKDVYRWLFKIRRGVSISAIFVSEGIDGLIKCAQRKANILFHEAMHKSENPLIQAAVQRGKFKDSAVNGE